MHIIYTTQTSGFKGDFAYRNPRYFAGVEDGAAAVTVVGDWPAVVDAYAKAGIDAKVVTLTSNGKSPFQDASGDGKADVTGNQGDDNKGANDATKRLTVPEIKEALAAKEVDIPAGVTKRDDLLALLETAE